jgi:hypothetical protein
LIVSTPRRSDVDALLVYAAELRLDQDLVLVTLTLPLIAVTFALPYLPFLRVFGFVRLPERVVIALAVITATFCEHSETARASTPRLLP